MKHSLIIILALLCLTNAHERKVVTSRRDSPSGWSMIGKPSKDSTVVFSVHMKLRNTDSLESIFWAVSDPQNPQYGNFLTREEIQNLISPNADALERVVKWLHTHGISSYEVINGYSIKARARVEHAEKLLSTRLFVFHSEKHDKFVTKHIGDLSVPLELSGDIEMVTGLSEFTHDTKFKPTFFKNGVEHQAEEDIPVTVEYLQKFYGVPTSTSNPRNLQAVAAFEDYFSAPALDYFNSYYKLSGIIAKEFGTDCIALGCDQGESDLDVQYMANLGTNVTTWFIEEPTGWILEWAQQVASMPNPPLVHSISYGAPEASQCDVDTEACSSLGLSNAGYVERTNIELQVLGVMGITVLAADGDDGSVNFFDSPGNSPLDKNIYCPAGGCTHTSTECGAILISKDTQTCVYPTGIANHACSYVLNGTTVDTALNNFEAANPSCTFDFEDVDSGMVPHLYSTCSCSALKTYTGLGYTISGYSYNSNNGPSLIPNYPASSPYLTAVSATQFQTSPTGSVFEVPASVASSPNPALITTGGGFSIMSPRPLYQAMAVDSYLTSGVKLPPAATFNAFGRGYPDISMNGHHYQVAMPTGRSTAQCPCKIEPVDGTSCSSPALAGMLSLINDKLLNAGRSPLGFINTALYQIAATTPQAFNDITTGNNTCNRAFCFEWGYQSFKGWDPVTGLGTPNFSHLGPALLSAKGLKLEDW